MTETNDYFSGSVFREDYVINKEYNEENEDFYPGNMSLENLKKNLFPSIVQETSEISSKSPFIRRFNILSNNPESVKFFILYFEINNVANYLCKPITQQQHYYMLCTKEYWKAKAILLSNEIFKPITDSNPFQEIIEKRLPSAAVKNLKLEIAANKALYYLLESGESEIISWAKKEDCN